MVLVHVVIAILVASCTYTDGVVTTTGTEWSYKGTFGPSTWQSRFPSCGGVRQSPINIQGCVVVKDPTAPKLGWANYDTMPVNIFMENNGHTLKLVPTFKDGLTPQFSVGTSTYNFNHIHFHWGEKFHDGSEHTINNKRYPLEMHAVHFKVVNGTQVTPSEIAVVTTLFQISLWWSSGLAMFLKYTPKIRGAETNTEIPPFPISTLLPKFTSKYYSYEGSLTTPPCSEVVTFFINGQLYPVTHWQMNDFRVLLDEEKEVLAGNFRPTQPLNGRVVKFMTT